MIAIVCPQFYGVHGIARYVRSFLENLPEGAPPLLLISGEGHPPFAARERVEVLHLPLGEGRLALLRWSWQAGRLLASLQRSGRIAAVNLHTPPLLPGLFLPRGLPLVLTMHSTYVGLSGRYEDNRHFPNSWNPVAVALKMRLERWLASRAQTVITLTEQGRRELACYGRRERVAILPNGVDTAAFTPDERVRKDIDVIFSGRIETLKGSRAMAEVCHRLVQARPGIRVAIVGYGADEPWVRETLAPLARNILFTGRIPFGDMAGLYRRSRLYASTSYHEGLPGTCLEAMAVGLPAVVWDRLFYRGLVIDGSTGRLAPVNGHDRLVAAVLELLDDPQAAAAMGQRARELVRSRYDWRQLSGQLLEVLARPPQAGAALP
jgi:glycosyltransferase involved in cell wall biosynthesis